MNLTPAMEKFVLHWGEMGARWGVNRSVAQIHGLLYLSPKPLPADEIAEALSIARSNVSMSLKELQSWGLVKSANILGDRRDHFETYTDPWDLLFIIVEERKRREIDPLLTMLRDCRIEAEESGADKTIRNRLDTMHDFLEGLAAWYDQIRKLPRTSIKGLVKLGGKVAKFIG